MKYLFLLLIVAFNSYAQKRELVARASDLDGFPAAGNCFFSNNKMVSHKLGLLVQYTCFGGEEINSEVWWIKGTDQRRLFISKMGNLFTTPTSFGDDVYVVEFNEGGSLELLKSDLQHSTSFKLQSEMRQVHDLAALGRNKLWARFTDNQGLSQEATWDGVKWSIASPRGVSYFFGAGYSQEMMIQKLRLGEAGDLGESRPDVIQMRLAPLFDPQIIVQDKDADPASPYLSFWNFSVVNGTLWSVIAKKAEGYVALVGDRNKFDEVKLYEFFKELDAWPSTLTSDGRLVIRATHIDGRKGLWIIENGPRMLLTLGDTVETDKGLAVVGETLFYNAPISLNDRVLIGVGLTEFGSRTPLGQGILSLSTR